jgi:hypothetical protein
VNLVEELERLGRRDFDAVSALSRYHNSLLLGKLHVCGNCRHFDFGPDPLEFGQCRRFSVEAWPFVPFWCAGFQASATPTAPAFLPDPDGRLALERELAKPVLSSVSVARVFPNRDRYG